MKHVIVIETPDEGGQISESVENRIVWEVEKMVYKMTPTTAFVWSTFNVDSAIAAVHEMYNVTK